jgi:DNA repair exonuclease SbcCD ATPase subunit
VTGQNEALRAEVDQIQAEFADLEAKAQLSSVYAAIGDFDARLVELPTELDAARARGYVHSGQLDDELEALDDRWDEVRPRVESALRSHVQRLDRELDEAERLVDNLRSKRSSISAARSAVNSLSSQVQAARNAVEGLYEGMDLQLNKIAFKVARVKQMMDLIDQSQEFRLLDAEGPLLAVKAEWHRDGEEGPEGVLFLTDQRMLFEQREEVVTKKVLGLFKADSEKVQDMLLDFQVSEIESVAHKEEGGFLGMGKDDIIELVLAATAPVSRVRLHLKGQESEDWAAMIKRIQTGDIDEDREDEYLDELEKAEAIAAAFPAQCPNCLADVPAQPRGVISVTCEFCGSEITPEVNAGEPE